MYTVRGTKKFLDRIPDTPLLASELQPATTVLGSWYATVLLWRQHVALFVNKPTRLPVLVPLAPGASVTTRMGKTAAAMFTALKLPAAFVSRELTEMTNHQTAKTANRSVVGTMNDFAYLADTHRTPKRDPDLLELSLTLAQTPCGPLYNSHTSPDCEIIANIADHNR